MIVNVEEGNSEMNDEQKRQWTHSMFKALPGYPFDPCQICVREGFKGMACDHTVRERAYAMHPGLALDVDSSSN